MIIHIDIHSHMRLAGYLLCGHSGSPWTHCWDPQWWAGDPGIRLAGFGNLLARFGHVLGMFWRAFGVRIWLFCVESSVKILGSHDGAEGL